MIRYSGVLRAPVALLCCAALGAWPVSSHAQKDAVGATIAAKGNGGGAVACATCHGAKGEGNGAAGFPRLAGLNATYIEAQLGHYADGKRQNPVMAPIAKQLSAPERKAVAAYYAKLAGAKPVKAPDEVALKTSETGAWLAERGRWDDNLPACVQCHGPGGIGVGATFPPIAGQSAGYLAAQLHAFKSGTRPGGPLELMTAVAKKLSDADITAVANHFGGAPQSASSTDSDRSKK